MRKVLSEGTAGPAEVRWDRWGDAAGAEMAEWTGATVALAEEE